MKTLDVLLTREPSCWSTLEEMLERASPPGARHVRLLPVDRARAEVVLERFQLPVWSALGALAWETGGVLVDHGWLRLLGGGGPWMAADLASYNGAGARVSIAATAGAHVVAVDVVGGGFVLNRGRLDGPSGRVWYLAPDTFDWIPLDLGYSAFFEWAIARGEEYQRFYAPLRWPGWQGRVERLGADLGLDQARRIWRQAARTGGTGGTGGAGDRRVGGPATGSAGSGGAHPEASALGDLWARTLTGRLLLLDDPGPAAARMSGVLFARRRRQSWWRRWIDRVRGRRR